MVAIASINALLSGEQMALIEIQVAVIDRQEPSIATPNMLFSESPCLWEVQKAYQASTPNVTGNISGNMSGNMTPNSQVIR